MKQRSLLICSLEDCLNPTAKLYGDQVKMEAHSKQSDENVEDGEGLGETHITRVLHVICDSSNMEMREDAREKQDRVGTGSSEASTP